MEIERSPSPSPSPSPDPRKLWKIVRIVFVMLKRSIAKSKVAVDFNNNLHLLLKRCKLAATKAIIVSQNDAVVYPRDYEFSCSNSPAFPSFHVIKRNHNNNNKNRKKLFSQHDDVFNVQKVLQMLNSNSSNENNDNKAISPLPGFGKSPVGKKIIRITDSPFPLKNQEEDNQVDVAAEEFIKRFYKDLNSQQKFAAIDSPYHCNLWDR